MYRTGSGHHVNGGRPAIPDTGDKSPAILLMVVDSASSDHLDRWMTDLTTFAPVLMMVPPVRHVLCLVTIRLIIVSAAFSPYPSLLTSVIQRGVHRQSVTAPHHE